MVACLYGDLPEGTPDQAWVDGVVARSQGLPLEVLDFVCRCLAPTWARWTAAQRLEVRPQVRSRTR